MLQVASEISIYVLYLSIRISILPFDIADTMTELPFLENGRRQLPAAVAVCAKQSAEWPLQFLVKRPRPGPAPIPESISGIGYLLL